MILFGCSSVENGDFKDAFDEEAIEESQDGKVEMCRIISNFFLPDRETTMKMNKNGRNLRFFHINYSNHS